MLSLKAARKTSHMDFVPLWIGSGDPRAGQGVCKECLLGVFLNLPDWCFLEISLPRCTFFPSHSIISYCPVSRSVFYGWYNTFAVPLSGLINQIPVCACPAAECFEQCVCVSSFYLTMFPFSLFLSLPTPESLKQSRSLDLKRPRKNCKVLARRGRTDLLCYIYFICADKERQPT